jgi:hypothetical protein
MVATVVLVFSVGAMYHLEIHNFNAWMVLCEWFIDYGRKPIKI